MIINITAVKTGRLNKGWTQQQLADVAALSLRTIQRVESQGQASMETCNALCSVLEIDRRHLLQSPSAANITSRTRIKMAVIMMSCIIASFLCGVATTLMLR